MTASAFDRSDLKWVHFSEPANAPEYPVDYALALLGVNRDVGAIDMLMKIAPHGHCTFHRHIGRTTTLVLEGEQHVYEPDTTGTMQHVARDVGGYALSPGGHKHIEGGGEKGMLLLLSLQAVEGHVFDLLDADANTVMKITIDDLETLLR